MPESRRIIPAWVGRQIIRALLIMAAWLKGDRLQQRRHRQAYQVRDHLDKGFPDLIQIGLDQEFRHAEELTQAWPKLSANVGYAAMPLSMR